MGSYWEPPQGYPPSPSTGASVVGWSNTGTSAEQVLAYTPAASVGLEVKAALVLSQAAVVSMYVAWKDLAGNNRQSVLIPEGELAAEGYPVAPCTVEQQAGAELTLWLQCSVAGAASVTSSIEELV